MEKVFLEGPVTLCGEVAISGSKNSMSAILPAVCLKEESAVCTIENVPIIEDAFCMCEILRELGLIVDFNIPDKKINVTGKVNKHVLSEKYVSRIRASSLFLGALVSAKGEACVPFCGGDKIGERPLDIHLHVLEKFGVSAFVNKGVIECKALEYPLKGTTIFLRYPSVGATENAILLAVKAIGNTSIYNAACEPEITDLAISLNAMGAKIKGAGTNVIHVEGVRELTNLKHELIPDRLECATYLLAFAITHGYGRVTGTIPEHNIALISLLKDIGIKVNYSADKIEIDASQSSYSPMQVDALPYPGIPTDIQPLLSTLAVLCNGNSVIRDCVFVDRFYHVNEYQKMGVNVTKSYNQAFVSGPQKFMGATVTGEDIRTVTSLFLAALAAEGNTILYGYEHIKRAYEKFNIKMSAIGARIKLEEIVLQSGIQKTSLS